MSAIVVLVAVLAGAALVSLFDEGSPLDACLCAGAPVGLALLGVVGLFWGSVLGLTAGAVALTLGSVAPLLLVWALPRWRPRLPARRLALRLAFWLAVGLPLWAVFDRVVIETGGGIGTGDDHNLGDLPFHFAIITGFVHGGAIPPEHPELSGVRLTYPILADFVAAVLVKSGASLRGALLLENLALALGFVGLLYRLGLRLTRDARAAWLVPPLVLLSGGLGFGAFFAEGGPLLERLLHLKRDYTITWDGSLRWGNAIVTLLVPQRSLLMGAPLAVLVWILWWTGVVEPAEEARRLRRMWAAGVVAGLMPMAHAHAFAVVLGMALCLALLFPHVRAWGRFFAAAALIALPQLAWLSHGSAVRAGDFVAWQLGWDRGGRNVVWFWLSNTGLFIPLLAVALASGTPRRLVRFSAPFLLLFLVPNLLRLSPWIWDNIKFLFFWYVGSVPVVAWGLARLARRGWTAALSWALVAALTLSGALDVWRMASRQIENRIFDAEAVAAAQLLLRATPPRALVLHVPSYDSPVYLAGRRSLLGYPGHIGSQGLSAGDREEVIRRIYAGGPDAEGLLRQHGIDYILVGPGERTKLAVNEAFLQRLDLAGMSGAYAVYRY